MVRAAIVLLAMSLVLPGCVSNRLYNSLPEQYIAEVAQPAAETVGVSLAVIEFDEFGMLWAPEQLEATLALIAEKNATSNRGIIVVTYTHGWMNNADPDREVTCPHSLYQFLCYSKVCSPPHQRAAERSGAGLW